MIISDYEIDDVGLLRRVSTEVNCVVYAPRIVNDRELAWLKSAAMTDNGVRMLSSVIRQYERKRTAMFFEVKDVHKEEGLRMFIAKGGSLLEKSTMRYLYEEEIEN